MDTDSALRRSLRKINPFKNSLFRLPATPRLSRSKKVGNGEDVVTEWNFERGSSGRCSTNSVRRLQTPPSPDTVSLPVFHKPPPTHTIPQPPQPEEAQKSIHEHMRQILSCSASASATPLTSPMFQRQTYTTSSQNRYLPLPNTKYRADGQVCEAYWAKEFHDDASLHNSTLSLLNTGRRSVIYDIPHHQQQQQHYQQQQQQQQQFFQRNTSTRNSSSYPLNGITRPSSADPFKRNRSTPIGMLNSGATATLNPSLGGSNSKSSSNGLNNLKPLFSLPTIQTSSQIDDTFIAREWVFKEIYQAAIVEKVPLTLIEGQKGSGKSSIYNQLVYNSPFHSGQASDTIDSGCVSDSYTIPSRNYEWMRAVAGRVVAYHTCSIQDASSCAIPEFVCNLGAMLAASPVLKSYSTILQKKPELTNLLRLEECLKYDSIHVFERAIAEPLSQLKSTDQGSLVILIDGIDEAEYHRCEDGRSIGVFLSQVIDYLPFWVRVVATTDASSLSNFEAKKRRSVRIDDCSLDERVVRDNRMYIEYRIGMFRELEDSIVTSRRNSVIDPLSAFSEQVVEKANGNMLYIRLLLQLLETGKLRMASLASTILPDDISGLYVMYMDLTFAFATAFSRVSPALSVLLASLRPLDRQTLSDILNSGPADTHVDLNEVNQMLTVLSPLLTYGPDGEISLHHPAFRDWLIRNDASAKYPTDVRKGHLLIALWLSNIAPLETPQLFELGHHLLKAHPYKYMHGEYVPELTSSKDGQILWIQKSSDNMAAALLDNRNMHYPNTKVSRLLLVAGADPSYCPSVSSKSSDIPLSVSQKAVAAGHWSLVSLLLHYGAGLHPDMGPSLLTIAAKNGNFEIVRQLRTMDDDISEAVREAAANNHLQILIFLLSTHWPSENSKLEAIEEAVYAAAAQGHVSICQHLIDNHSQVDFSRPMRVACENGKAAVVQFFISRGATLSSLSWPSDKSTIHCAVESGSWDLVVAVLSLPQSNLEVTDAEGRTPLICAARCGHVGLIDMLINKGANVNHRDISGWTAIMHAIRNAHLASVQLLLDKEVDIHGIDVNG
ncbi:unnamed protein product [Auanema sp. JU1783]|nr:unnamed protein product [Auanema sp. JU1783]